MTERTPKELLRLTADYSDSTLKELGNAFVVPFRSALRDTLDELTSALHIHAVIAADNLDLERERDEARARVEALAEALRQIHRAITPEDEKEQWLYQRIKEFTAKALGLEGDAK